MNIEDFRASLVQNRMYKVESEHYSHVLPKDMSTKDLRHLMEKRQMLGSAALLNESVETHGIMRLVD